MKNELISTRDPRRKKITLKGAILKSQPLDKGLYVFTKFPKINLSKLYTLNYQEHAEAILSNFDFKITSQTLQQIIYDSYGKQWNDTEITPITKFEKNKYLLELYHGPTQAFKDLALQFLPRILSAYKKPKEILRALGASSGDTISAAHFGVGNIKGLQSYFLLPKKGPSKIQLLQATSHGFKNAATILIAGDFDAGQKVIKKILTSSEYSDFKKRNNFITFNSINILRILVQTIYYFYSYSTLVKRKEIRIGDLVNFSVPSGNFGDALAGVYAQKMGLPISKINIATNANDVLHKFLQTGKYIPRKKIIHTLAPSQDITIASNFERMLFEVVKNPRRVSKLMINLKVKGFFEVNYEELTKFRKVLTSSSTTDIQITRTMKNLYSTGNILIDPHTATGVHGGTEVFGINPKIPTIFLATAEAVKFPQPPGVPQNKQQYTSIVKNLERNPKTFFCSTANEKDIVRTLKKAINSANKNLTAK